MPYKRKSSFVRGPRKGLRAAARKPSRVRSKKTYTKGKYSRARMGMKSSYKSIRPGLRSNRGLRVSTRGFNPASPVERKFKDSPATTDLGVASGIPGATLGTIINELGSDSSISGRIGRKVSLKSFQIRLSASVVDPLSGASAIRLVVFQDRQANANPPTAADVFATTSFTTLYNQSNSSRFRILHDSVSETLNATGIGGCSFAVKKKLTGVAVYQNDNDIDVPVVPITNSVGYFVFGNFLVPTPATSIPVVIYPRVIYTDA